MSGKLTNAWRKLLKICADGKTSLFQFAFWQDWSWTQWPASSASDVPPPLLSEDRKREALLLRQLQTAHTFQMTLVSHGLVSHGTDCFFFTRVRLYLGHALRQMLMPRSKKNRDANTATMAIQPPIPVPGTGMYGNRGLCNALMSTEQLRKKCSRACCMQVNNSMARANASFQHVPVNIFE